MELWSREQEQQLFQPAFLLLFSYLVLIISLLANHTSEKCDVNIFNHHIHTTIVVFKIYINSLFPLTIFTDRAVNVFSSPRIENCKILSLKLHVSGRCCLPKQYLCRQTCA